MKVTDMFVVSFRGVNYAFWLKAVQPELRCPDVTLIFLAIKVRLMVAREKKNLLVVLLLEFFNYCNLIVPSARHVSISCNSYLSVF